MDDTNSFRIVTEQNCDATIEAVHNAPDLFRKGALNYIGSVPLVVAQIWAKQCGAPVGSKEFIAYGHKQLKSGEYSKLHAKLKY